MKKGDYRGMMGDARGKKGDKGEDDKRNVFLPFSFSIAHFQVFEAIYVSDAP